MEYVPGLVYEAPNIYQLVGNCHQNTSTTSCSSHVIIIQALDDIIPFSKVRKMLLHLDVPGISHICCLKLD